MPIEIVYETHSFSEDNERGIATGWLPGRLSERGRTAARELGERRRHDNISAVFASDLGRAVETASIAFDGTGIPLLLDWRLRECDYGDLNGAETTRVHHDRVAHIDVPYPNGESWQQAVQRCDAFFDDVASRWDGRRILVIGHMATRYAFEQRFRGVSLQTLLTEDFQWQEGWEYLLV